MLVTGRPFLSRIYQFGRYDSRIKSGVCNRPIEPLNVDNTEVKQ